jgi:hypothetical protein
MRCMRGHERREEGGGCSAGEDLLVLAWSWCNHGNSCDDDGSISILNGGEGGGTARRVGLSSPTMQSSFQRAW